MVLHTEEITVGKKLKTPVTLTLIVDDKDITSRIFDLENEYLGYQSDPSSLEDSGYLHSESGESKTAEGCLEQQLENIVQLKARAKGLIKQSAKELALEAMQTFLHENKGFTKVNWSDYFQQIARKKDGTFAVGRIVSIYRAHGFSWEDTEAYGRKGPEMIIKTISDTQAHLHIRSGIIEKW